MKKNLSWLPSKINKMDKELALMYEIRTRWMVHEGFDLGDIDTTIDVLERRKNELKVELEEGSNDKPTDEYHSFVIENRLSEIQRKILNWLLGETEDVQTHRIQPTELLVDLATGNSGVPPQIASLWRCTEEHQRQQIVLKFLAIRNDNTIR